MDHFKLINDTFGHLTGDAIISETAATIKHFFMDNSLCGRIGGDEFMIFVKNVDDTASLILQAELLRQEIYGHLRKKIYPLQLRQVLVYVFQIKNIIALKHYTVMQIMPYIRLKTKVATRY